MNIKNISIAVGIALCFIMVAVAISSLSEVSRVNGAAPAAVPAIQATSSTITVGIQSNATLFTPNTMCVSRVISTGAQAIMLSFDSSITPGAFSGHVQAASTTVAYDASLYGCGTTTAYGFSASTTVNKSEFR